jgi:WD40 repeat protein
MLAAGRVLLLTMVAVPFQAQQNQTTQNCPLPPVLGVASPGANIFSEQQESNLGDVMAERVSQTINILHDDSLTEHLHQLGDRLLRYLPETKLRYQFLLVDLPEPNAFSLPGGRVYISRKIVALARNDDELAGILAHELGHIVTHQQAIEMTSAFHDVLSVTQVGDRADIANKYHQYLESYRRNPGHAGGEEEGHQYVADQVALFAMARAGYAPQAYVDIWDRFQETHGNTGSWFSDIFGRTKPSQRRLREMLRSMAVLPSGCAEIRPSSDASAYQQWQAKVVAAQNATQESLPGLVVKQSLAQPLRPDLHTLHFSPDGKYVLAQDDGGIHILSREPFALLFFIDAPDAFPAGFSPDSLSVVFYTHSFRVETWSIVNHERSSVHEVLLNEPCIQSTLSPDGKTLGCLKVDHSLTLLDVANGETLATKPRFFAFEFSSGMLTYLMLAGRNQHLIHMEFSPDGRYFLAGSHSEVMAYDLQEKREVTLPGSIRDVLKGSFAFVGPDRIAGVNMYYADKSPLLQFPQGKRIAELPLTNTTNLESAAHGDYLLIWPVKDHPLGVMSLNRRVVIAEFKHKAGDIFDNWILSERNDGELGIFDIAARQNIATVPLSQSHLGTLRAVALGSDFNWLAISTWNRGAMWDLKRNTRVQLTRSFDGGWFGGDNALYADFPKFDQQERAVAKLTTAGNVSILYEITQKFCRQAKAYLVCEEPKHANVYERKDWTVEIHDVATQRSLWSRYFPAEIPVVSVQAEHTVLLGWRLSEGGARDQLQKYPDIKDKAEREDYLLEILDFSKDAVTGKLLVKTGKRSFQIEDVRMDGDWILVNASADQILVYSAATGEEKTHVFGKQPALSAASGQFAVLNPSDQLNLYDLATGKPHQQLKFSTPVAFEKFSPDGKRLFVMTRDQTAYILDLSAP